MVYSRHSSLLDARPAILSIPVNVAPAQAYTTPGVSTSTIAGAVIGEHSKRHPNSIATLIPEGFEGSLFGAILISVVVVMRYRSRRVKEYNYPPGTADPHPAPPPRGARHTSGQHDQQVDSVVEPPPPVYHKDLEKGEKQITHDTPAPPATQTDGPFVGGFRPTGVN
ncbi:hypothetical protein BKA70DRAFT_680660 [Coprinopsis sp. MPI-PUGE-AT-0042]|nr:hypothetical protein BKA70DRAFT_680660 [Coprinopsis sp. MPI-PUGE-AT-0042]